MSSDGSRRTSLQAFIDRTPLSRRQRWIVFLSVLVMVADGMDITIVSHLFPRLIGEWGVSIGQVTFLVTAGVIAMAIGAFLGGPAADRWGRKTVIVTAFVLFNLTTAAMGAAPSFELLSVLRLIACLGLGAVMPVTLTIVADWVPTFRRAQMVALVFSGVALGSIVGAYLAATLIPAFGWQVMIGVAGLLPLLIVPFFIRSVPEPPNTLIVRGRTESEIHRTLSLIAPDEDVTSVETAYVTEEGAVRRGAFSTIFSRALVGTTALLWMLFFITQGLALLVLQYLPILLQRPDPGLSTAQSGQIVAMWGLGGLVGQVSASFVLKRLDRFYTGVVAAIWTIAGALVIATVSFSFSGLLFALFATGMAFASMPAITNSIATIAYPTQARATGVGTAGFVGRLGSLTSGLVGGLAVAAGWGLQAIFAGITLPVILVAATFIGLRAETRRRERAMIMPHTREGAGATVHADTAPR